MESASENSFGKALLAVVAGPCTFIGLMVLALVLANKSFLGFGNSKVSYLALIVVSGISAIVTAAISPSPWPRGIYLVFGSIVFLGLALMQAAFSDGHPDHALQWLAPLHLLISCLVFLAMPGARPNPKWRMTEVALTVVAASGLAYGVTARVRETQQLHRSADNNVRLSEQLWLPSVFMLPPKVAWSPPEFLENEYSVNGQMTDRRGSIAVFGTTVFDSCAISIQPSHPFQTFTNEDTDHYLRRVAAYLREQGCTDEVLRRLSFSPEPKGGVSVASQADSLLDNVPIDPSDPKRGVRSVNVRIAIAKDWISIDLQPDIVSNR